MARLVWELADHGGETSSVGMSVDSLANEGTLRSAIDGVSLGVIRQVNRIEGTVSISGANASSPFAQVELGLRVHVSDNVNSRTGFVTIPCPDLANLTLTNDQALLADGSVMQSLVSAIEAHMLSRDGNPVTVTSAQVVGRNR